MEAVGRTRLLAGRPRLGLREVDRWDEASDGRGKLQAGADQIGLAGGRLAAENQQQSDAERCEQGAGEQKCKDPPQAPARFRNLILVSMLMA